MDTSKEAAHRGFLKLMLRLPALRGELQLLRKNDRSLEHLCEAYEDATVTLERLLKQSAETSADLVAEYRDVCRALETDVERHCGSKSARSRFDPPAPQR